MKKESSEQIQTNPFIDLYKQNNRKYMNYQISAYSEVKVNSTTVRKITNKILLYKTANRDSTPQLTSKRYLLIFLDRQKPRHISQSYWNP